MIIDFAMIVTRFNETSLSSFASSIVKGMVWEPNKIHNFGSISMTLCQNDYLMSRQCFLNLRPI